jgi:hypothetical protein
VTEADLTKIISRWTKMVCNKMLSQRLYRLQDKPADNRNCKFVFQRNEAHATDIDNFNNRYCLPAVQLFSIIFKNKFFKNGQPQKE